MRRPHGRKLSTQILVSQLTILVASMLVGFGLFAYAERTQLDAQYKRRALAIAETVAWTPEIQEAMSSGDSGVVQTVAERMRRAAGASYVVVIDRRGIRHSHPNPALIGKPVTEPLVALDGRGHVGVDHHSSVCRPRAAWGRAPLYGTSGALVGEVSAGICEKTVTSALWSTLPTFALWLGIALGGGVLASYGLAWRLKRRTFGLELEEISTLLQEREALLYGIKEGVIAFDRAGRVTIVNDEARRLLGLGGSAVGQRLETLVPPGRLRDVLAGSSGVDLAVLTDSHYLTVNRRTVSLGGRELGAVVTLRDRTELSGLLRELDSVRGLTDALRAQQHEFSNRMHTVAGLLELGNDDEALAYLTSGQGAAVALSESMRERIANPLIVGLILAKSTVAAERGVELTLTEDSWFGESPHHVQAVLTILGNLIDNAVDAAAGSPPPCAVTVRLSDSGGITMVVSDTGPGIPAELAESIFIDGYSTKPHTDVLHRGLGLAIVHRLVRRIGGEIGVEQGPGATFVVSLPKTRAGVTGAGDVASVAGRAGVGDEAVR